MKQRIRRGAMLLTVLAALAWIPRDVSALEIERGFSSAGTPSALTVEEAELPTTGDRLFVKIRAANLVVIVSAGTLLLLNYRKQI